VSGRRIHGGDDRTRAAVWLIRQDDGSWLIDGVDEHPIRLPREVTLIIAENVLRHPGFVDPRVGTGVGNSEIGVEVVRVRDTHWQPLTLMSGSDLRNSRSARPVRDMDACRCREATLDRYMDAYRS
jgi:hypothetical protein